MEILILGGLLVIIMVIASTKIKKSAAAAYLAETIENEDFSIEKPEGFLYPLRDKPDYPFEAYSKTFGEKGTRNIWRARVRLRINDGQNINALEKNLENSEEAIISKKSFDDIPSDQTGKIVRSSKTEDEVDYKVFRKIIESSRLNRTYELRTTLLEPYEDEYTERVCDMMKSFSVK